MGLLTISDSSVIYVDTSVVIYTIEQVPGYHTLLEPLWVKFEADTISLLSSELILLEALVLPLRRANATLTSAYEQLLLASNFQLIPINQPILRSAAQLRATTNLKTPDAIHAATALAARPTLFLTNDSQFRAVAGLPVVLSEGLTS
ncbi:PIN domain-containing protein [Leptolyngbya sp. NK1-12]|uniref:Ribonuclease VapC n=1 Tax=Leptolyngbya sp. NK1-12 TaxID=2547451 RepID=A0AA97AFM4_9CYAN|nr:PIN domain-containing protein [Leptolyngbya sp. NK1-12]